VPDLDHPSYPTATTYDPTWLLDLDMGPNPLWLLEDLLRDLSIRPGDRVLDLGSGRGATSVYLARELGVEVWAVDLWVPAAAATRTFQEAGVADAVHADARALPFDPDHFDAIVSIDAWEYFGTDDRFLPSLLRVLRPGGQLGVATPSMARDVRDLGEIPPHIAELVGWEALAWHSVDRWCQQWMLTGLVDVISARSQPDGWADWCRLARALAERNAEAVRGTLDMLDADGGELLGFALLAATRR